MESRSPGRPLKHGVKKEQFTITLCPLVRKNAQILANNRTNGSISALVQELLEYEWEKECGNLVLIDKS